MTIFDLHKFDPFSIGYDRMFDRFDALTSDLRKPNLGYPPYNIKKIDDNNYTIELALAGFSKTDINIEIKEGTLTVSGSTASDDSVKFLHKGIADRSFSRQFQLADTVEVKNADLTNGMLKIWLENIIPESKKPKKIHINELQSESTEKQLLNEEVHSKR